MHKLKCIMEIHGYDYEFSLPKFFSSSTFSILYTQKIQSWRCTTTTKKCCLCEIRWRNHHHLRQQLRAEWDKHRKILTCITYRSDVFFFFFFPFNYLNVVIVIPTTPHDLPSFSFRDGFAMWGDFYTFIFW